MVLGTKPIEAIVAAFRKAATSSEDAKVTLTGLRLATGAKAVPDLHRFDPMDRSLGARLTKLQHVVSSTRALVSPIRTNAVNAGARFRNQPTATVGQLNAELIGMRVSRQVIWAGDPALKQHFPVVPRPENSPTGGRQIGCSRSVLSSFQGIELSQGRAGHGTFEKPLAEVTASQLERAKR